MEEGKSQELVIPNHIAFIMDGNGRWAKAKGLPRSYGHIKGCANLETIVDEALDIGIKYVTFYAFSTENWKRSREEIERLMKLFRIYLKKCIKICQHNHICMRVIGDVSAFDADIRETIAQLEDITKEYEAMYLQIALNYGSRDEITRAVRAMAEEVKAGSLLPEAITEDTISSHLDTKGLPDPDLLIRTSGELRLSNYLMWQLAYSEFYFTDKAWPDFDREELMHAIRIYNDRDRRYGKA